MASGDFDLVITLIGKDGVGKSTTGNALVGRQVFKSGVSGSAVTLQCQCESTTINGRTLRVVDSPGLEPTQTRKIVRDIVKLSTPGSHAVLVCIRIGRFTDEDHNTVEEAKKWFGKNLARHLIVVFTGADELEGEGVTEDEFIQTVPPNLKNLLELLDNRYLTVNNRAPGADSAFVKALLAMVEDNSERIGGVRYTEQDYMQTTKDIEEDETRERRREELKRRRERDEIEITFKNKCARLMEEVQVMKMQMAETEEKRLDETDWEEDGMEQRKQRLMGRLGYSEQRRNLMLQIVRNEERRTRAIAAHRAQIVEDLRQKEAALEDMMKMLEADRAEKRAEVRRSEERERRMEEEHRRRLAAIDAEMNKQQQALQQHREQAQTDANFRRRMRSGDNGDQRRNDNGSED